MKQEISTGPPIMPPSAPLIMSSCTWKQRFYCGTFFLFSRTLIHWLTLWYHKPDVASCTALGDENAEFQTLGCLQTAQCLRKRQITKALGTSKNNWKHTWHPNGWSASRHRDVSTTQSSISWPLVSMKLVAHGLLWFWQLPLLWRPLSVLNTALEVFSKNNLLELGTSAATAFKTSDLLSPGAKSDASTMHRSMCRD